MRGKNIDKKKKNIYNNIITFIRMLYFTNDNLIKMHKEI